MKYIFEEIDKIPSAENLFFNLDKFCSAFLNESPIFINKFLPKIDALLASKSFQEEVLQVYTQACINERTAVLKKLEPVLGSADATKFYMAQLKAIDCKLAIKTFRQLVDYLKSYLSRYPDILEFLNRDYKIIHQKDGASYIKENYIAYRIGSILYINHQSIKFKTEMLDPKYFGKIEEEYRKIGIDLAKEDPQFSKYRIVSLNNNHEIFSDENNQAILDNRIQKYLKVAVPNKLLSSIKELIEKGMVSDISFRILSVSRYLYAAEAKETGTPLQLKVSALPSLSKFYSVNNYENNLWIQHDKERQSLTFEELTEDFEIIGDDIVTQVVHLEYRSKDHDFFITHLDHELIAYKPESYQERLSNPYIKGHQKVKSFKIDNSMIPFNISTNGDLFLLQVLDSYFKNKDLINEYFEKIK